MPRVEMIDSHPIEPGSKIDFDLTHEVADERFEVFHLRVVFRRNDEPEWSKTLQGKARGVYNFFVERGKAQGFKLKAMVLDFPGGVPGDVGLIVSRRET